MIKGFDHLHFYCRDVEEAARFFETFLEAKVTVREEMFGAPLVRMNFQGTMVILATASSPEILEVMKGKRGLDHIGVLVEDLKKTMEEMKEKGGKFSKDYTVVGPPARASVIKFAFLEGPDGIQVELVERE